MATMAKATNSEETPAATAKADIRLGPTLEASARVSSSYNLLTFVVAFSVTTGATGVAGTVAFSVATGASVVRGAPLVVALAVATTGNGALGNEGVVVRFQLNVVVVDATGFTVVVWVVIKVIPLSVMLSMTPFQNQRPSELSQ
jgi:hypothetical protein